MSEKPTAHESPNWDSTTKMIAGLTFVGLIAALIIYFRGIIGPLLVSFILSFVLHPVASWSSRTLRVSWRFSVNVIYLILVVVLIALITVAGFAIVDQIGSLVNFIERFVNQLPDIVEDLSDRAYYIGPFQFEFSQLDLTTLVQQLLNTIQPLLGQAGTLVSKFAASAATTLGWTFFAILISYFFLSGAGQIEDALEKIDVPGYGDDIQRLIHELAKIWDIYLRGQLFISFLIVITYYFMLTILGTRLALAIAIVAGLSRFVPYIGPVISWATVAIVAFLQTSNYFGMEPFQYMILVLVFFIVLDQIFDYLIVPRFLGQTLGVHPAAVLIVALIAANLIGIVGLVLAAPVLATVVLLGRYVIRKMFDMDPWPETEIEPKQEVLPWIRMGERMLNLWYAFRRWLKERKKT
jgi:predicted PurR-regulated permease PerM